LAVYVGEHRRAAAREVLRMLTDDGVGDLSAVESKDEVLNSPYVAMGTVPQICEHLSACRAQLGISHFCVSGSWLTEFGNVVERLAGC
jgi:hypothetical protein